MGRAAGIRVAARTAGEQGGLRQSFKEEDGFRFCSMRLKLSLLLLVVRAILRALGQVRRSTMKIAWGKNSKVKKQSVVVSTIPGLPFGAGSDNDESEREEKSDANTNCPGTKPVETAVLLQSQGDKLAEEGKYHEALAKWEAALILTPDNAILHEQKAQVLLEVGDAWRALTAATRATELDPFWPEAWVTLGRAQLNFGEPDSAILTFDKALAIKPDYNDAKADRETAARLVKKRGQLHTSGLSANKRRFTVGEYPEKGAEGEEKGKETAV